MRGLYRENISTNTDSTDFAALGKKEDRGLMFSQYSPEQAWLIRVYYTTPAGGRIAWDHLAQCPVQHLDNIGPAIEYSDWLILVFSPRTIFPM